MKCSESSFPEHGVNENSESARIRASRGAGESGLDGDDGTRTRDLQWLGGAYRAAEDEGALQ